MKKNEFDTAVVNLRGSLRPFALKLTRNSEEADDLTQETMLKAISNRDKFADGSNLKAWLFTIMRNTFITNYHRLTKRQSKVESTDQLSIVNYPNYSTENDGKAKLNMDNIQVALERLRMEYRTPFIMYYQGYKYQEIAEILGMPLGTVKNHIHMARRQLKDDLSSLRAA